MTHYQIIVSDHLHPAGWDALAQAADATCLGPIASRPELLRQLQAADALIVRSSTQVDAELLAAGPRLKVIARAGVGLENIDLDEATRLGIAVIHTPLTNLIAVAEHTFAMLLGLARGLQPAGEALRAGGWPRHQLMGFQLHGKRLGIIGYGRLGRELAARAQAFGMHVLAYDPYIDFSFASMRGVEMVNFDELLGRVDIIVLATALTDQTRGMLDAGAFSRMRPRSYLVNCVQAGLVVEDALLEALDSGRLAGAALDTFSQEPLPLRHPFRAHPNLTITPHLNQNTEESQAATCRQVVEDVLDSLRGLDFRNVANLPFTPDLPYSRVHPYLHLAVRLGRLQGQLAEGWITRVEVELLGEGLEGMVRPVTAVLLAGMLRPVENRQPNWISAPALAHAQGIETLQAKGLVSLADYPNLIACRVTWQGGNRTVAGALFGNAGARLVQYDEFHVDAYPEGYVLVLENDDVPGVIGQVGAWLGSAGINIAQWRYGRERPGGRAVSFINLDQKITPDLLLALERDPAIRRARLVRL